MEPSFPSLEPCHAMGSASRRKGAAGELEVRRILQEHGFTVRASQRNLGDSQGDSLALGHGLILHVEAKRRETLEIWRSLKQTADECPPEALPLLAFRRNRSEWYGAMPLVTLLSLCRKLRCRYCGRVTDGIDVCAECVDIATADALAPRLDVA